MKQHIEHNDHFLLAENWINETSQNIFLTGKAGTGKTTLLKHICATSPKQSVVLAPTGVAAINAGGSTIHSFFKIPFALFLPTESNMAREHENILTPSTLLQHIRYSKSHIHLLRTIELVIIDEVSMVRVDVMDIIDTLLRRYRAQPTLPFGGVQMLFIGDMYQLPPVVKDQEARILMEHYNSPYFFDSKVLQENPPVHIALTRVYRQAEPHFLQILNELRINEVSEDTYRHLLSKVTQVRPRDERYITLTSHVAKADEINRQGLNSLFTPAQIFKATIEGDFAAHQYPAAIELELKEGARVMFIKNDPEKKFYNGKTGTVTRIEGASVWVKCDEDETDMEVQPLTWENTRYSVGKDSGELVTDVLGTFTQLPLRHAWAVTIHKSQGLTFEYVVIDAGKSFAAGQVYVALSRCRTWEGIVLLSAIKPEALFTDVHIVRFGEQVWKEEKLHNALPGYKRLFQQEVCNQCFDLSAWHKLAMRLNKLLQGNQGSFSAEGIALLSSLVKTVSNLAVVAERFLRQMQSLQKPDVLPLENVELMERLRKASTYFLQQTHEHVEVPLQKMCTPPDNSAVAAQILALLAELREMTFVAAKVWACSQSNELSVQGVLKERSKAWFDYSNVPPLRWAKAKPLQQESAAPINTIATQHKLLEQDLRAWRITMADELGVALYQILSNKAIDDLVKNPPQNKRQLLTIKGIGKKKVEAYGADILGMVAQYFDAELLADAVYDEDQETQPKPKRSSTYDLTYMLIQEGKSLTEVARERNLAITTIAGHIAKLITQQRLRAEEFLSAEKIKLITNAYAHLPDEQKNLTALHAALYEAYSFEELRIALATINNA